LSIVQYLIQKICICPTLNRCFPSPAKVKRRQINTVGLQHSAHLKIKVICQVVFTFETFLKFYTVPGLLDKKGGRRCHLLLNKRCYRLPPFLSNETGTVYLHERCLVALTFRAATSHVKERLAQFSVFGVGITPPKMSKFALNCACATLQITIHYEINITLTCNHLMRHFRS
jgi:hypothetical protein